MVNKKFVRTSNVNEARLISVIEVKSILGAGVKDDPIKEIREYFLEDGKLLARTDYTTDLGVGAWK